MKQTISEQHDDLRAGRGAMAAVERERAIVREHERGHVAEHQRPTWTYQIAVADTTP